MGRRPRITVRYWPARKRWVVRNGFGKPRHSFFATKAEAEAEQKRLEDERSQSGDTWNKLPPSERNQLILIYQEAQKAGVNLLTALELAKTRSAGSGPTLRNVIDELLAAKRQANRSSRYTDSLELLLNQFALGRESVRIGRIGLADVESFLGSKSLASRSTIRARLSTLFKFAMRRHYVTANPCAQLEAVHVDRESPRIFTAKEFSACMEWFKEHRHAGPWFILSTLCGLRPEEAEATKRTDIHFKEGWVRVEAQTSKVRQRRIVYPRPEALQALKRSLRGGSLPISRQARRRAIRALRKALKWSVWPKDITRHTAASYLLPVTESVAKLADQLGNSEKILLRDYRALVTMEQAREFWKEVMRR